MADDFSALPPAPADPLHPDHGHLKCVVVTPERVFLDEVVDYVVLPLEGGEAGILPRHQSMIGRLTFGTLRIRTGEIGREYFVDGGFAQVKGNVVTVLTSRATPVKSLDAVAAEREFELVLSKEVKGPRDQEDKDRALQRARSLRRLARKFSGSPEPKLG